MSSKYQFSRLKQACVLYFPSAGVTVTIDANAQGNFSLLTLGLAIGDALGAVK